MILSAVLMTLCTNFLSAAEHPAYHTVTWYIKMLSIVERQMSTNGLSDRLFFLRSLRKCRCCRAFFTTTVMLSVHVSQSEMRVPKNLKL